MTTAGKDLAAFRSKHDKSFIVPEKIRKGLDALGDSWEYEAEFIKRCQLSQTDFAKYRDQFSDHLVTTSGADSKRVVAGTKKFAKQLTAMATA